MRHIAFPCSRASPSQWWKAELTICTICHWDSYQSLTTDEYQTPVNDFQMWHPAWIHTSSDEALTHLGNTIRYDTTNRHWQQLEEHNGTSSSPTGLNWSNDSGGTFGCLQKWIRMPLPHTILTAGARGNLGTGTSPKVPEGKLTVVLEPTHCTDIDIKPIPWKVLW